MVQAEQVMWSLSQLLSSVPMRQSGRLTQRCVSIKLQSQSSSSPNFPVLISIFDFSFTMKHLKIYYFYCLYFSQFFFFLSPLSSGFHPHNLEDVYKLFQPIPHFSGVVIGTSFRIWHGSQFLPPGLTSCPWCFLMRRPLPSLSSQLWELFQVQPHITLCLLVSFSLGSFVQCCIPTDHRSGPSSVFIWTVEVH